MLLSLALGYILELPSCAGRTQRGSGQPDIGSQDMMALRMSAPHGIQGNRMSGTGEDWRRRGARGGGGDAETHSWCMRPAGTNHGKTSWGKQQRADSV
eukprot:6210987-Pleurochrysis_carterae.AAC.2